jgi:hypothetical protein
MKQSEVDYKDATLQLAKTEIENEDLKNDIRHMGFMVEDLE